MHFHGLKLLIQTDQVNSKTNHLCQSVSLVSSSSHSCNHWPPPSLCHSPRFTPSPPLIFPPLRSPSHSRVQHLSGSDRHLQPFLYDPGHPLRHLLLWEGSGLPAAARRDVFRLRRSEVADNRSVHSHAKLPAISARILRREYSNSAVFCFNALLLFPCEYLHQSPSPRWMQGTNGREVCQKFEPGHDNLHQVNVVFRMTVKNLNAYRLSSVTPPEEVSDWPIGYFFPPF